MGLQRLSPGDRLVVIVEHVDEVLAFLQGATDLGDKDYHCTMPVFGEPVAVPVREPNGVYEAVGSMPTKGKNGRA
jgi:hypothetical protein